MYVCLIFYMYVCLIFCIKSEELIIFNVKWLMFKASTFSTVIAYSCEFVYGLNFVCLHFLLRSFKKASSHVCHCHEALTKFQTYFKIKHFPGVEYKLLIYMWRRAVGGVRPAGKTSHQGPSKQLILCSF